MTIHPSARVSRKKPNFSQFVGNTVACIIGNLEHNENQAFQALFVIEEIQHK